MHRPHVHGVERVHVDDGLHVLSAARDLVEVGPPHADGERRRASPSLPSAWRTPPPDAAKAKVTISRLAVVVHVGRTDALGGCASG